MSSLYGSALSGVRTYAKYVNEKVERLHALQPDRIGDDPIELQKAQYEAAVLSEFVTQAKGVASLLLKIIQPIN